MKAYRLKGGAGSAGLSLVELPKAVLAPDDVRVRMRAFALNYRDLLVAKTASADNAFTPGSDGAGEVVEIGSGVTHWKPGDRVFATFYPKWICGNPTRDAVANGLGGGRTSGVFAEEIVLPESAFVSVPDHLGFAEAATIPCAGVTAWNALFRAGGAHAGQSVLLLGTGGVSIWALQLAKAAGLRTIITSSSDDKLRRAQAVGASGAINYREYSTWGEEALRLTHGTGVDLVVEVGGKDTFTQSIAAARAGGSIAMVGGTSGSFAVELAPFALISKSLRLLGVLVGSREMAEELSAFISLTGLRPIVDRSFDFGELRAAYEYLESGRHFGKVVVEIS